MVRNVVGVVSKGRSYGLIGQVRTIDFLLSMKLFEGLGR